jgi:endogenous inhibitor of DNA gyrase (YacG/DUF329 family)
MARAHRWQDDGQLEDGDQRRRCARCGVCAHWRAARLACELSIHAASRQPRKSEPVVTVPCGICRKPFVRHSPVLHLHYCGDACALEARRASNRKAQARYAARKREARCS